MTHIPREYRKGSGSNWPEQGDGGSSVDDPAPEPQADSVEQERPDPERVARVLDELEAEADRLDPQLTPRQAATKVLSGDGNPHREGKATGLREAVKRLRALSQTPDGSAQTGGEERDGWLLAPDGRVVDGPELPASNLAVVPKHRLEVAEARLLEIAKSAPGESHPNPAVQAARSYFKGRTVTDAQTTEGSEGRG